jgi:hypothetical protein
MSGPIIIGWDCAKGTGDRARELSELDEAQIGEAVIFKSHPVLMSLPVQATQFVDLWGLDPRLVVVPQFYHRKQPQPADPEVSGTEVNMPATVTAHAIVRSGTPSEPVRELYQLPTAELFGNAGVVPDGVELVTGMQGIRFKVAASLDAPCVYELVMSLLVIPNIALVCADLAQALIKRLRVDLPAPHAWVTVWGG